AGSGNEGDPFAIVEAEPDRAIRSLDEGVRSVLADIDDAVGAARAAARFVDKRGPCVEIEGDRAVRGVLAVPQVDATIAGGDVHAVLTGPAVAGCPPAGGGGDLDAVLAVAAVAGCPPFEAGAGVHRHSLSVRVLIRALMTSAESDSDSAASQSRSAAILYNCTWSCSCMYRAPAGYSTYPIDWALSKFSSMKSPSSPSWTVTLSGMMCSSTLSSSCSSSRRSSCGRITVEPPTRRS